MRRLTDNLFKHCADNYDEWASHSHSHFGLIHMKRLQENDGEWLVSLFSAWHKWGDCRFKHAIQWLEHRVQLHSLFPIVFQFNMFIAWDSSCLVFLHRWTKPRVCSRRTDHLKAFTWRNANAWFPSTGTQWNCFTTPQFVVCIFVHLYTQLKSTHCFNIQQEWQCDQMRKNSQRDA